MDMIIINQQNFVKLEMWCSALLMGYMWYKILKMAHYTAGFDRKWSLMFMLGQFYASSRSLHVMSLLYTVMNIDGTNYIDCQPS